MKYITSILFSLVIFLSIISCSSNSQYNELQATVTNLFVSTDKNAWQHLEQIFAKEVYLDYSSFTGAKPAKVSSKQIIKNWSSFLPRFKSTHHQLGNFQIKSFSKNKAKIFCYGTANHYLPDQKSGNIWTVVGSYDFDLELINHNWRITKIKFNFKYQDGNLDLPKIATSKQKN